MMKKINDKTTNNHEIMKKMNINRINRFSFLDLLSSLKISLPLFIILVLAAFRVNAQLPEVAVRFANPVYDCTDQTYCLDVEFRSNTAGQQLFGMNVRFYYDDNVLELISFSDYQPGYGPVSPNPPQVITGNSASGPDLFGFTGPAEFINGAIQLVSAGDPIIISTTGWTKLFSVCFDVVDPDALNTESFCPGVVWDLEENPADGGFSEGSEGVVITVVNPDPNLDSSPATESCEQFNWSYDGVAGIPYGALSPTNCIATDIVPPVITGCPTEIINLGCNPQTLPDCDDVLALNITASDECSGPITPVCEAGQIIEDNCMMTRTFTLTATDDNGNSSYCDITYTWVVDTEAPVFSSCPAGIVDLGCTPLAFPDEAMAIANAGTATDLCDQTLDYSAEATSDPVNDGCEWTQTWTVTAATECGPDATCEVTFTWYEDDLPPVFSNCPSDVIDLGCNPTALPDETMVLADAGTATDICDQQLDYRAEIEGTSMDGCAYTQIWLVTADADCGPDGGCEVTYIWYEDTQAPVFAGCPVDVIDLGYNPESVPDQVMALEYAGDVTDNCDMELSVSAAATAGPAVDGCTFTQTWIVTADADCGPDATCEVNFTWVIDTGEPIFSGCPQNPIDLGCNPTTMPDCDDVLALGITANDGCAGPLTPVCQAGTPVSDGCMMSQTFTLTATDDDNNSATCEVVYTWTVNTEPPLFSECPLDDIYIGCNPETLPDGQDAIADAGIAVDNCGGEISYSAVPAGEPSGEGCMQYQTWTVTATPECGPEAVCSVTYTWTIDTEAPAFTAPEDVTIYFDADCEYDASPDSTGHVTGMEDNCSTELNPTWEDVVDATDPCAVVITRTWSLADECGNEAENQVQLITVMDTIAPTFNAPPDITIYPNEDLSYNASPTYTGNTTDKHDNCYVGYADYEDVVVETGGEDTIAVITRTWSLEDDCGNQAEDQVQIITVRKTPPVVVNCTKQEYCIRQNGLYILTQADMNVLAGYASGAPEGVQVTVSPDYFTCDQVGIEIPVTVTATDRYGNTAQCMTTVLVCDEIFPEITPPDDIVVMAAEGECGAVVDFAAEADDNCSAIVTYSQDPGTLFPVGTTTVTATATDIGGNTVSCEFDITVTDDGAPLINCPNLITVYVAENEGGASVEFEATASDDCSDVTVSYSIEPGTFLEFGTTTVTATATDESGNQASCSFDILVTFDANPPVVDNPVIDTTINVSDTTKLPLAPVFTDPDGDDLTITAEQEDGSPLPDWIQLTGDTLVFTPSAADTGCVSIVVTATSPGNASVADTFQVCADDLTGIDHLFPGVFEIIMYPNPTPGKVTVDMTPGTRDDIQLTVLDITGKMVLQKQYSPSGRILFDLSNNATGMYFVHLEFSGVHLVKKLVVDRR